MPHHDVDTGVGNMQYHLSADMNFIGLAAVAGWPRRSRPSAAGCTRWVVRRWTRPVGAAAMVAHAPGLERSGRDDIGHSASSGAVGH